MQWGIEAKIVNFLKNLFISGISKNNGIYIMEKQKSA